MHFSFDRVDVINLFAEDFTGTKVFYQEVLGLSLTFEDEDTAVFGLQNVMICLNDAPSGADLIAPAALADRHAGSRVALSMFVDDVDAVCAELTQRGVVLTNGPIDQPWGVRTAGFADPAGHHWRLAQDLDEVAPTPPAA
jgi:uncharacterized glyoxalase superfamily protein PhnB